MPSLAGKNALLASPHLGAGPDRIDLSRTRVDRRRDLRVRARAQVPSQREDSEGDDGRTRARSRALGRATVREDGVRGFRDAEARSKRRAAPAIGRAPQCPAYGTAEFDRFVRVARRGVPAEVTRVAAVDLGTNTTRLLVADVVDGHVDEVSL